jgi:hypothetical protein
MGTPAVGPWPNKTASICGGRQTLFMARFTMYSDIQYDQFGLLCRYVKNSDSAYNCLHKQGEIMFTSVQYDVAGPGVLIAIAAFSVGALIVLTLVISVIEAIVMLLLKWDKFGQSLWASFLMNVTSTILGGVLIALGLLGGSYIWLVVAFVLSVLIEGGVLMLIKRGAARQNWTVSLISNLVSYLFIILPIVLLNA